MQGNSMRTDSFSHGRFLGGAILAALAVLASAGTAEAAGLVSGRVSGDESPLPQSQVYAYQLGELTLRKVVTDSLGNFEFRDLPTGLYKIIAFKPGFLPGVALLSRASAEAAQFLDVELQSQGAAANDSTTDFWSVRQQIPTDVLRDIDLVAALPDAGDQGRRVVPLRAEMRAVTGVDSMATAHTSQLSGGQVNLASAIEEVNVDVRGRYVALEAVGDSGAVSAADGYTQLLSVDGSGIGSNRIQITSLDNSLRTADDKGGKDVGLQSHRLSWSRQIGESGRSEVSAQYVQENNFYARSGSNVLLPTGSRMWNLEGTYSMDVSERSSVETGFRFSDRDLALVDSEIFDGILPRERMEIFGRAGTALTPGVLVEYGLYSTLRDGTMSLAPQGGVVLQLNDAWRASTSATVKMHADPIEARRLNDFHSGYFRDYASCERAAAECYQVVLSRSIGDQEKLSIGGVQRRFDETLSLHFDQNFFNYRENLQLVHGDSVPEIQFTLTQRLSPNIITRLESSLGEGGGGLLIRGRGARRYENDVRYLVTSLDTLFEQSATGVFVAFHQLNQSLNPLSGAAPREQLDLERLQVMLTQDLAVLSSMAADWAIQLNMELSRGLLPDSEKTVPPDELRQRITGGLTVSF
jgi:Carboxypeptidase regulatory-like domain